MKHAKYAVMAIIFLYLLMIFVFSNQNGTQSNNLSWGIMKEIKQNIPFISNYSADMSTKYSLNYLFRKTVHFTEYFLLAMIIRFAMGKGKPHSKINGMATVVLCFLFAAMDELHQSYVPGRTPLTRDVIVDVSGALTAVFLFWAVKSIKDSYVKKSNFT